MQVHDFNDLNLNPYSNDLQNQLIQDQLDQFSNEMSHDNQISEHLQEQMNRDIQHNLLMEQQQLQQQQLKQQQIQQQQQQLQIHQQNVPHHNLLMQQQQQQQQIEEQKNQLLNNTSLLSSFDHKKDKKQDPNANLNVFITKGDTLKTRGVEEEHVLIMHRNGSASSKSSNSKYQCKYCGFEFVGGPQKIRVHLTGFF
jgi:hypothetical protein